MGALQLIVGLVMATNTQIARELGISVSTVSRALTRPEMVAADTRELILAKAQSLGLKKKAAKTKKNAAEPNAKKKAAKSNANRFLGVIVADLNNPFSAGVLNAISERAREDDVRIILGVSKESAVVERKLLNDFNRYNLLGLIAMPVGAPLTVNLNCRNVVTVDRPWPDEGYKCALLDNAQAVAIAYEHLKERGHERIAFLSGKASLYTFRERLNAAQSYGLECFELDALEYSELYNQAIMRTDILLKRSDRPSAIITANNAITSGVVYALTQRNVQMPQDMALVSIGDPDWCRFFPAPITAVKLPDMELGYCAYDLLKKSEPQVQLIEPTLEIRSSS